MPKGTSCCSACTSSRSTSAPVLMAPEHQPVVHHEGLAGPGGWWQQLQSYPSRCWARRGSSSMCPDRLILYTKCALMCLQGLSGQNHVGIPVRAHRGCALTCALKNRAYGASVPAGGVCLQGQFYGTWVQVYIHSLNAPFSFVGFVAAVAQIYVIPPGRGARRGLRTFPFVLQRS